MTRDTLFVTTVRRRRAAVAIKWPKNYTSLKLQDLRRRTRSAQAAVRVSHIKPLPRGVFKLVLSFWESKRDWWWYGQYGDRSEYWSCD